MLLEQHNFFKDVFIFLDFYWIAFNICRWKHSTRRRTSYRREPPAELHAAGIVHPKYVDVIAYHARC